MIKWPVPWEKLPHGLHLELQDSLRRHRGLTTMSEAPNASECWHSVILRGLNSATYKMALAWCIAQSVEAGKTRVTMDELAEAFLDVSVERLRNGMPQLSDPNNEAGMEGVVREFQSGRLDRRDAVGRVRAKAFVDVLRSFHMVDRAEVPVRFFTIDDAGLLITEDAHRVITREGTDHILAELDQKWAELEMAWKQNRDRAVGDRDSRVTVWVADVGSISRNHFGWCKAAPIKGTLRIGVDIAEFADGICEDISDERKVALGFECPLFIPVPEDSAKLGKARVGDGDRAWSATAGAGALAIGMVESAWVFRRIARTSKRPVLPTLRWPDFHQGQSNLFVWEAFVSGKAKSGPTPGMRRLWPGRSSFVIPIFKGSRV